MKSRLALLAVPFLALACTDAEQATLLEPPAISADVLITNFVLSHVECAIGQTGFVRYIVEVSSGGVDKERTSPCPHDLPPGTVPLLMLVQPPFSAYREARATTAS